MIMTAGTTILATSPDGQYFVYDPFLSAGAGYYLYDRNTGVSTEFLQNVTPTPQIYAVNDSGDVVGTATVNGVYQGFSYLNGAVAVVNVPGSLMEQWAVFGSGSSSNLPPRNSTTPYAINHAGNITGTYIDGMGAAHAFTDFNGVYTLNLPTSILNSPSTATVTASYQCRNR
jgi:hypothetical protein